MIYCVKCENVREACYEFDKFLENVIGIPIKKAFKRAPVPIIILENDDEFHFVSRCYYERWCKGRTYTLLTEGRTYHSGWPCKIESSEDAKNA